LVRLSAQAMGAALLVAMAALLCARIFRRPRRWRNSTSAGNLAAGGHRRVTSLQSFSSLASPTGHGDLLFAAGVLQTVTLHSEFH